VSDGGTIFTSRDSSPFGRRQRRVRGARIPVTVISGFLGSGKTTLIRELLATPEGTGTAIIVNEYGEVGIDDALLRGSSDAVALLGNGCLCCTMRSDLQETLRALFADRARGAVPGFERVVIETSGLADPGPILQTFASDRALGQEFHLQSLVTVIDAPNGSSNLDTMPEARHQVALADRIILTKTDLVPPPAADALSQRIAQLTAAPIARASQGVVAPGFVFDEPVDLPTRPEPQNHDHGHGHDHSHGHDHAHDHEHTGGVDSFTVLFDRPLPWGAFDQAMAVLTALRGPDLLRVKGIVAIEGCRGPVVIHAVQQTAHRPIELETWPTDDHRSRLVFIARDLSREPVERLFAAIAALGGTTPAR
jgi:G3E family GTPase